MFTVGKVVFLAVVFSSGLVASTRSVQRRLLDGSKWLDANVTTGTRRPEILRANVSECVLLFGAFCNGNLGDIIQASTMSRLVKSVASDSICVWHAHPSKEKTANGFQEGEFFANNSAGIIPLGCERESGEQVARFKGFVIGGGGLLESRHWPLDCEAFVAGLGDELPVAIFAVGASTEANWSWPIIQRANYVSGRDQKSVAELSSLLGTLETPRAKPHEVARVRDPVLSDGYFMDVDGACWKQSEGPGNSTQEAPLCFILPSAMTPDLHMLHRVFSSEIVHQDDILLNLFPKHQAEIEAYPYPVPVEAILDPEGFPRRLCGCRAVVTSRLHGTILSLQSGVPTLAAWPVWAGNKVPDLMKDVLNFPDQFLLVKDDLTREMLDQCVGRMRSAYANGRRDALFEKLDFISRHTKKEASLVLERFLHVPLAEDGGGKGHHASNLWKKYTSTPHAEEEIGEEVQMAAGRVAEIRLSGESSTVGSGLEAARHPDYAAPFTPWKWWGAAWRTGERPQGAEIGGAMSLSGSPVLSLGTLVLIALLGLPGLASLSKSVKSNASSPADQVEGALAAEKAKLSEVGPAATNSMQLFSLFGGQRPRMMDFAFFGLNYVMWVMLSMGFSICSKAYMDETGNPMALLAIQGWIGTAILCAMNVAARCRRRSAETSSSPNADGSVSSSTPSWLGRCGLKQARRVGRNVWQAGLLHSGNAVLTSWSVLVGGVAATHALKALEPVAAAGFSRWLLGSKLPLYRAVAVAIIVLGLGILMVPLQLPRWIGGSGSFAPAEERSGSGTWHAGTNLAVPALMTMCACCTVALRNVLLKRPDPPPPPPPLSLLVCCIVGAGVGSFALLVPLLPFSWEWAGKSLLRASGVNAALCFVGYNLASFNLLSELSPVGHAVGSASKRVCLFATGLFLLGEEGSMSPRQLAGASLAFVGLASYNLAGTLPLTVLPSSR